ncbi:hypothetical protein GCM10009801_55390 [Streptomyces albiaxialis]|uniref:DUF4232 domain-containing protein n=1 Tax=Streptomyces albiaxialis TaxID=329523 RepID=A0ABN2WEV5_9ACTN
MRFRLFRRAVVLGSALLALPVLLGGAPASAAAVASASSAPEVPEVPRCVAPGKARFALGTRVTGGPAAYAPGGGRRGFRIEMRNDARGRCAAVHPILVLLDRRKALRPAQIQVRFRDPGGTWRPVRFRHTGPGENVGVFTAPGFHGYALQPGGTASVRVQMRFAEGTEGGNGVRASVSSVQRRGADGEWVGESAPYRFTVGAARR